MLKFGPENSRNGGEGNEACAEAGLHGDSPSSSSLLCVYRESSIPALGYLPLTTIDRHHLASESSSFSCSLESLRSRSIRTHRSQLRPVVSTALFQRSLTPTLQTLHSPLSLNCSSTRDRITYP